MPTTTKTKTTAPVLVTGYYLENKMPGHNKFYTVLISEDGTVLTNWGRIGGTGQSKIDKLPTADKAEELGLRQFYSKRTRGYETKHEGIKFEVDSKILNDAHAGALLPLLRAFQDARVAPEFTGESNTALRHYDDFAKKAQALLNDAPNLDFETLWARHSELEEVWATLSDKHAEVATIVNLTKATLMSKLSE